MHHLTITFLPIRRGVVARVHLESAAGGPVTVTLGKNVLVPVLRNESQYHNQQADWQMSDGAGSDWVTIRCEHQVALISWSAGRFVQRSGSLPIFLIHTPLVDRRAEKMHTHALGRATA